MLKETVAAGFMAAALALTPTAASAKTQVHIGVGIGVPGPCYGYGYGYAGCGYGYYPGGYYPYDNWDDGYYRNYRRPNYYYRDYPNDYPAARVSCGEARRILSHRGFRRVQVNSCGGRYHTFIARKGGETFVIKVSSRNGAIRSIREY